MATGTDNKGVIFLFNHGAEGVCQKHLGDFGIIKELQTGDQGKFFFDLRKNQMFDSKEALQLLFESHMEQPMCSFKTGMREDDIEKNFHKILEYALYFQHDKTLHDCLLWFSVWGREMNVCVKEEGNELLMERGNMVMFGKLDTVVRRYIMS